MTQKNLLKLGTSLHSLKVPNVPFDSISFVYLAASIALGEDVCKKIRFISSTAIAVESAFKALSVCRIGVVCPYNQEVYNLVFQYFRYKGVNTNAYYTFSETHETQISAISPSQIFKAAVTVGKNVDVECVLVCCTNLHCLHVVSDIEYAIGKPVVTTTQATIWHSLYLPNY